MSSSASSSSSGGQKKKSRKLKDLLGIRWAKSSSSSDSSSPIEGTLQLAVPGGSSTSSNPVSLFMGEGNPDWANPEWEEGPRNPDEENHLVPFPCQVTCSLMILSRRPIKNLDSLKRKLELWVDQYNGSYVCRPYHTLVYILLGTKLVSRKSTSRNYEYHSKYQGVIRFGVYSNINRPSSGKFRLVMSEGIEDSYYAISFECHLVESKRKGVTYLELYKLGGYHCTLPAMLELLNLDVVFDSEGLVAPA